METRNETAEWVDREMAAMLAPGEWSPDTRRGLARLNARREAMRRRRRRTVWVAACASVGVAGAMSVPVTRAYAYRCVEACVAEGSRVGRFVLAKLRPGDTRAADRTEAPDFALKDADGRTIRLSDCRGQVVVLNFWATWCPPCRVEIPWFVEFQRAYRDRGFTVIGVSLDEGGWDPVRPFLARHKVNYPVAIGGEDVTRSYGGVESLPTTLIVDRQGRIAATHVGLVSRAAYEKDILALLEEAR